MSEGQKVIKYIAIALAVFLTVNIIGGIITAALFMLGITGLSNRVNSNTIEFSEIYTKIESLDIECKMSNLTIKEGEEFKVEASNVTDKFYCKNDDGILKIKDKKEFRLFYDEVSNSEIIIYIPKNTKITDMKIETGAGKVDIAKISADNIKLSLGAGTVKISDIDIKKSTKIDGGVGKVTIENSIFNNLELDVGVGEFDMNAKLIGDNDIDCGVGKLSMKLIGNENDYEILAKKGLGSFTINSKEVQDNTKYGNGENYIKVDAGVGSTVIQYK